MRRTFTSLLIIVLFICGKQGYDLLTAEDHNGSSLTGSLSDIAEEVIAIPLQKAGECVIKDARDIRQEGNNLFLINEGALYRFNRRGEFVCRISDPKDIQVASYAINPANRQLIVLGNSNDIFYYSFEGDLLTRKKLEHNKSNQHLLSIALHDNKILTIEECIKQDPATPLPLIEKQVVEYDTFFHKIKTHRITRVDLERAECPIGCLSPIVSVEKDSGQLYVFEASRQPDNLLRDTLYLRKRQQSQSLADFVDTDSLPLLPVRIGSRFWVSTYYNANEESKNYTFCYDTQKNQYWHIKDGLKDNFYQTGPVAKLEAMDPYNQSYSFCKSGQELKKAFPDNEESLVLFIVKLKA